MSILYCLSLHSTCCGLRHVPQFSGSFNSFATFAASVVLSLRVRRHNSPRIAPPRAPKALIVSAPIPRELP